MQGGAANVRYLHDARARNLNEANLWHGGEAERSRCYFEQLSASDRAAMLAFCIRSDSLTVLKQKGTSKNHLKTAKN